MEQAQPTADCCCQSGFLPLITIEKLAHVRYWVLQAGTLSFYAAAGQLQRQLPCRAVAAQVHDVLVWAAISPRD